MGALLFPGVFRQSDYPDRFIEKSIEKFEKRKRKIMAKKNVLCISWAFKEDFLWTLFVADYPELSIRRSV